MLGLIIILSVLGFLMIFAEVYLPGGVIGALGGISLLAAVAISYGEYGFGVGTLLLVVFLVVGVTVLTLGFYILPKTRAGKVLVLNSSLEGDGLVASTLAPGTPGSALTDLRPSGTAVIDGKRLDVLAQTGHIKRGSEIQVVRTEGPKIIVRLA